MAKPGQKQDYITTQLYHVMTTSDVPYHVAGTQQDNSTVAVSSDDGTTCRQEVLTMGGGGEPVKIYESC